MRDPPPRERVDKERTGYQDIYLLPCRCVTTRVRLLGQKGRKNEEETPGYVFVSPDIVFHGRNEDRKTTRSGLKSGFYDIEARFLWSREVCMCHW